MISVELFGGPCDGQRIMMVDPPPPMLVRYSLTEPPWGVFDVGAKPERGGEKFNTHEYALVNRHGIRIYVHRGVVPIG